MNRKEQALRAYEHGDTEMFREHFLTWLRSVSYATYAKRFESTYRAEQLAGRKCDAAEANYLVLCTW